MKSPAAQYDPEYRDLFDELAIKRRSPTIAELINSDGIRQYLGRKLGPNDAGTTRYFTDKYTNKRVVNGEANLVQALSFIIKQLHGLKNGRNFSSSLKITAGKRKLDISISGENKGSEFEEEAKLIRSVLVELGCFVKPCHESDYNDEKQVIAWRGIDQNVLLESLAEVISPTPVPDERDFKGGGYGMSL